MRMSRVGSVGVADCSKNIHNQQICIHDCEILSIDFYYSREYFMTTVTRRELMTQPGFAVLSD